MEQRNYYEILVNSIRLRSYKPLTYHSDRLVLPGQIVGVTLGKVKAYGIVLRSADKPPVATKEITDIFDSLLLPQSTLQFIEWMREYYPSPLGPLLSLFLPNNILQASKLIEKPAPASIDLSIQNQALGSLPQLTDDQASALNKIESAGGAVFLHGDTGTGKTRVYIEAAAQSLRDNKSVIILTPEIGLTPQLEKDFAYFFGSHQIIVIHSNLTKSQRLTQWVKILYAQVSNLPLVVIGPRSALFYPLANVGLIVIDECHEQAYKQEQAPYYQANRAAGALASIHHAKILFGSATPPVTDYYYAERKNVPIVRMKTQAAGKHTSSEITVLDMREPALRHVLCSPALMDGIAESLHKGQQSLIYLNRRGTAQSILCQACGWRALCAYCEHSLTYHGDNHQMRCHICGNVSKLPLSCPECGNTDIAYKTPGTKSIVDQLQSRFPAARIQRFDTDNKKHERIEHSYGDIQSGNIDILVGTQLLAKGLDLPRLGFLGVISADSQLAIPDYSAAERTFQLLYQVVGRIGRGHIAGKAVIQTYEPNHYAITCAVQRDWDTFYDHEVQIRDSLQFPPFSYLLQVWCKRKGRTSAKSAAEKQAGCIKSLYPRIRILGPSPMFQEKQGDMYRWQLIILSKNRKQLLSVIASLPGDWYYNIDPANLM